MNCFPGYSGGGGSSYDVYSTYYCRGDGGSDGNGGENGYDSAFCSNASNGFGGDGAHDDVLWLSAQLLNFNLSPGEGGRGGSSTNAYEVWGGGGGGVLVDNTGPPRADSHTGEGYGGGGGAYPDGVGLPGGVLLDFLLDEHSHNKTL